MNSTTVSWSCIRWLKQEAEEEKISKTVDVGPKLDLGFKEGQTITLNLGVCTCVTTNCAWYILVLLLI